MISKVKNDSLRKLIYHLRNTDFRALMGILERKLIAPHSSFSVPNSEQRFCLLISGCPGDSYRYRCEHQAAQLRSLGLATDICYDHQLRDHAVVDSYQWLWLHRVPYSEKIGGLIEAAGRSGKPVVFDTDDLVFDEKIVSYMRSIEWMSAREVEGVVATAKGYYQTLSRCSFATVSTDCLRDAVQRLLPNMRCFVTPNMLSDAQLALAEQALQAKHLDGNKKKQTVTIGYFSGTRTHNADFRECSAAMARIMDTYPQVGLMLVGYLDIDPVFDRFGRRVERHRFAPWERLATLFGKVDINLAPLERDNPFAECKSDLKYLEAAIMGIPTVASAIGSFDTSITHAENGCLCRTGEEWFACLSRLVEDSTLRHRIGNSAKQIVRESRTVARGAAHLQRTILESLREYPAAASANASSGNVGDITTADL